MGSSLCWFAMFSWGLVFVSFFISGEVTQGVLDGDHRFSTWPRSASRVTTASLSAPTTFSAATMALMKNFRSLLADWSMSWFCHSVQWTWLTKRKHASAACYSSALVSSNWTFSYSLQPAHWPNVDVFEMNRPNNDVDSFLLLCDCYRLSHLKLSREPLGQFYLAHFRREVVGKGKGRWEKVWEMIGRTKKKKGPTPQPSWLTFLSSYSLQKSTVATWRWARRWTTTRNSWWSSWRSTAPLTTDTAATATARSSCACRRCRRSAPSSGAISPSTISSSAATASWSSSARCSTSLRRRYTNWSTSPADEAWKTESAGCGEWNLEQRRSIPELFELYHLACNDRYPHISWQYNDVLAPLTLDIKADFGWHARHDRVCLISYGNHRWFFVYLLFSTLTTLTQL